jgi:hypothetical protein
MQSHSHPQKAGLQTPSFLGSGDLQSGGRLYWLNHACNSALEYEPKCGGRGELWVSANKYNCAHEAQINFRDLTPP